MIWSFLASEMEFKEIRQGRGLDSAGYGTVADSSDGSTELLLVTKGIKFPYPELITLLYTWGVQVLLYPNFFLGNGSR